MINQIKIEMCEVAKDIKGGRFYNPVDITDKCNLPLLNINNLDDALDTSVIEVDLSQREPIEPFTKIILRVNEVVELTEEPQFNSDYKIHEHVQDNVIHIWRTIDIKGAKKIYYYTKTLVDGNYILSSLTRQLAIYRYVDNDTPTQVVFGNYPQFKHTLNLIEISKKLEREDCDNSNITHTIVSDAYETVKETVDYSSGQSISGWHIFYWQARIEDDGYIDNNRFKQPFIQGDGIPLNVRLNVRGQAGRYTQQGSMGVTWWGISWKNAATLTLHSMTITTPNGTTINVTNIPIYTTTLAGTYKIQQTYKGSGYGRDYTYTASWSINVWSQSSPSINKKTIAGSIDRLLAINPLRREGLDSPKYSLKESLREPLNNIQSPEFSFTLGHLMDNLSQVGSFIHGIPRVTVNEFLMQDGLITKLNDWQKWDIVDFDFLGGRVIFENQNYSNQEGFWGAEDYANNFITNIENAVQTNFRSYTSAIEPFDGGYISPRTESSDFILTDDNVVIKTSLPIYRILSLECYLDGQNVNLTDYVAEVGKYITLTAYSQSKDSKAVKIYYTKGGNLIEGLTFKPDSMLPNLGELFLNTTIRNITGATGPIKNLAFRVTYIPYRNFKARQFKPLLGNNENTSLFYNQQANVVDIESYGESMKGALLRTGNPTYLDTFYFNSFEDIPEIGMVTQNGYYIYSVSTQIFNNSYKCTIRFSKDFNKLNEYIGIKSDYRQYEISENESTNRNVDYNEFCILTTIPDTDDLENSESEEMQDFLNEIKEYLSKLGVTQFAINSLKNKLSFINGSGSQSSQLSFAYLETQSIEYDFLGEETLVTHKILLPLSGFSFGNSIVVHFKTQDNFAANTKLVNMNGAKALEEYLQYSNFYGNIDTMKIAIGIGLPSNNLGEVVNYSKELFNFENYTLNENNLVVDFRANPFWMDKDSRESISFTYQLHFVTNSINIQIGKSMSEVWGLVGDATSTLKVVEFKTLPSKFENSINNLGVFTEPNYTHSVDYNSELRRLTIKSPMQSSSEYKGWGILTNDNKVVFSVNGYEDVYLQFRHKI